MNIRIIKNAQGLKCNTLSNGYMLQTKETDSEYENISLINYYLYDPLKNESVEIEPAIKKYNLIYVKDIKFQSEFVYFTNLKPVGDGTDNMIITLYRYDISKGESVVVYRFEEKLEKYSDYMRTRIFAVNEYYLFIQNEYLRANLTENYADYFDFELSMYSINEDKLYKINDENLNHYGIIDFEPITSNICVLKQGFDLYKDERYKILKKSEAAMESVNFVNMGQMVSDILLGQSSVVMDSIENVYYTATIPYIKVEDDYVIYSKVKLEEKIQEEIVFYNFAKKEAVMCINGGVSLDGKLAQTCVIAKQPFIIFCNENEYEFIDITEKKKGMSLEVCNKIEYLKDNLLVTSITTKGFFGKEKKYIMVYKLPEMKLLHKEKANFIGCTLLENEQLYIMTGQNCKNNCYTELLNKNFK